MKYLENEKMKEAGLMMCKIDVSYNFSFPAEEEELFRKIKVELVGYDENEEDSVNIASADILMVPSPWYGINCDEEEDMFLLMDDTSEDLGTIASALKIYDVEEMEDNIWEGLLGGDLFYISQFSVDAKYRKLGTGSILLEKIPGVLEDMLNLEVGILALIASPFEISYDDKKYAAEKKKLFSFYKKNGYDLINKKEGVMVRNRAFELES